jgi:spore maturation protein CgeB
MPVKVIGKDWNGWVTDNVTRLDKNITLSEVADAYNRSAYILNIKHEHNVVNGLNMRSFEAPACGACLLQDYVKDVELNFDTQEEIVVYRSLEEMNEKLALLRGDKPTFDKICRNGYKRVMSEHTYRHRVNKMLIDLA